MTGDVPKRQYYARRAKTANANCRVCDIDVTPPKRRRVGSRRRLVVADSELWHVDNKDRISNLPQDLIHCIVKRLSVHDAARTSVLSKEWRFIWGMSTELVLDELFFSQLILNKDKEEYQSVFLRAIERIVLVHVGPVLSFNLYIPPKLNQCPVSRWIEHFLKKGVTDIELTNSEKNEIPSCLYDCAELTHLKLDTWIFNPPYNFTSVSNLTWVKLINISFNSDISFGTQLTYLNLELCTGIEHLACQFANGNSLKMLRISASEQIDWRWFKCTKLKFFGLELNPVAKSNMKTPINLFKLLNDIPSLYGLYISGFTLEVLGPDLTAMKGLAAKVENLKVLMLNQLGSFNLRQISKSLHLIRCLPNLRCLDIILEVEVKSVNSVEITSNWESVDWKDMSLGQLHTVKMQGLVGSNYVFDFIKVMLASSPSLKVMSLCCKSEAIDPIEKLKIKQELQKFPRRSVAAKIILR